MLSLSWREHERHPGFFEVNYTDVVHNGFERNGLLSNIFPPDLWYWDQYEPNLLKLVSAIKHDGFQAINPEEQNLAAWQIFLIMADSWISANMASDFFLLVERSIRPDMSLGQRLDASNMAQEMLARRESVLHDLWSYQILPLAKCQGNEWLVKLINE